jgi:hypothetical protein
VDEPIDLNQRREQRQLDDTWAHRDQNHAGEAVPGSVDYGAVVCTACGARFAFRERQFSIAGDEIRWFPGSTLGVFGLEDHWALTPACRASLNRPIGQFDPPKNRATKCCVGCHERTQVSNWMAPPCPQHAYRGCPGC